jgi:predicted secreted acid phosphatase
MIGGIRVRRGLVVALLIAAITGAPSVAHAATCPVMPKANIPPAPDLPLNIDHIKKLLRDYKASNYETDIAAVFKIARTFVEERAGQVKNPALILDIDETSLSNWDNISANDFGFIGRGTCDLLPDGPCGFKKWVSQSRAQVIEPARELLNAAKAKGAAVIFITGRRHSEWDATLRNLNDAKLEGWTKLITRPDYDHDPSPQHFKAKERAKVEAEGYTIIANVGDQESDLAGGHAECTFKLPNPFYFIK